MQSIEVMVDREPTWVITTPPKGAGDAPCLEATRSTCLSGVSTLGRQEIPSGDFADHQKPRLLP